MRSPPDFRLEDVWALPVHGEEESDFHALVQGIAAGDPSQGSSWLARALWSTRWKVGELLGWDDAETGLGARVPTLHERLPGDLLDAPSPGFDALPFTSLYLIEDEFAAEIANRTMHGVMHLSWVADGTGDYRGQMAVLVKPNGLLGAVWLTRRLPASGGRRFGCCCTGGRHSLRAPVVGLAHHLDRPTGALGKQHRAFGQFADGLGGRLHKSIPVHDLRHIMRSIRAMQTVLHALRVSHVAGFLACSMRVARSRANGSISLSGEKSAGAMASS